MKEIVCNIQHQNLNLSYRDEIFEEQDSWISKYKRQLESEIRPSLLWSVSLDKRHASVWLDELRLWLFITQKVREVLATEANTHYFRVESYRERESFELVRNRAVACLAT